MIEEQKPQPPDASADGADDAVIGRALRGSLIVLGLIAVAGAGVAAWVYTRKPAPVVVETPLDLPRERQRPAAKVPQIPFTDITRSAGITFVHENGARGKKLLPETMGGGCAFFDYDNDGHQDLLFINSMRWPDDKSQADAGGSPTMALYHNDGRGNFKDVTAESGLGFSCYGMGVAVGDYDNDGWVDVFISAVGANRLFRNNQGKFEDVTATAGVAGSDREWSTSCGWFDYDNDGDLDLFVCNYVRWSAEIDAALDCRLTGTIRAYCRPDAFEGTFPYLYRNNGDGTFADVSKEAGMQAKNPNTGVPMAKSLGLLPIDLDGDGWLDIVIANDTVQNFLFHNERNGTFAEIGAVSGIAFDNSGSARGAMGIDGGYFRNDNSLGIVIGNFANEMTALYCTQGRALQFSDDAVATGLGPPSRPWLKFGVFFFDADLDGRLDLLAANGHLEDEIHKVQQSQQYQQPPQLYWNCGTETGTEFLPATEAECGSDFVKPIVGRGATFADIDGDGDLDVVLTSIAGPPRLLRNDQQLGNHWLRFKLVGAKKNRDALGAWVDVHANGQIQRRQVMPTRSYMSQSELPVTFGLGKNAQVEKVVVRWPDGTAQTLTDVGIDRLIRVEQPAPAP